MAVELESLLQDIVGAVKGIVDEDWPRIAGFARTQSRMLANHAAMISAARATGSLRHDDEGFAFFISQLEAMTRNFAQAVAAQTAVTLERAWNAVVGVIWGAINAALGGAGLAAVPRPAEPGVAPAF